MATNIEKENLEAHVEICALRYAQLDNRLHSIEEKVEKLEEHILFIKDNLTIKSHSEKPDSESSNKTIITIGTTIIGALITGIIVVLVNFINKA